MNHRVHIYCNMPGNKLAKLVARRPEVLTGSRQMSLARVTYFESRQIDFLSGLAETWHTLMHTKWFQSKISEAERKSNRELRRNKNRSRDRKEFYTNCTYDYINWLLFKDEYNVVCNIIFQQKLFLLITRSA